MCVMIISTAFHIQKSFGANLASPSLVDLMLSADSRGRASARSGAGHNDYLPLFQRGSAPVSMTTRSLLYSVGLDIQSVSGEGCRGATQQMHFPQQDARLIPGTV